MSHVDDEKHAPESVSSGWQTTSNALTRRLQYRGMLRLKPLVLLLGAFTTGTWLVVVNISSQWGAAVNSNLLADDGPGELWIPPDEHPVPLSKFPDFTGLGSMSRRDRDEKRARQVHEGSDEDRAGVTLLFLHVWKCAGSSMRHMLRDWAELEGQSIGIVIRCSEIYKVGQICLQDHQLLNARVQGAYIRRNQVLAGHFTWGFQYHVRQPYVMFTTLRNPLELFVSGQQYLNRKAAKRFSNAVEVAASTMRVAIVRYKVLYGGLGGAGAGGKELDVPEIQGGKAVGFIYRLVEPEVISAKTLDEAAEQAINNLDTFWLVGVVEQYRGFMVVLREMMDPLRRHKELWKAYEVGKFNTSPNGAGRVLAGIEAVYPGLMREFNETLRHQWMVYQHAKNLFSDRCREILHTRDYDLCDVPSIKSEYTMTDFDKNVLFQELQAGGLHGSEGLRPSGGG